MRAVILVCSMMLLLLISCTEKTESDTFTSAMEAEDAQQRIEALTAFLNKFPESDEKNRALYTLLSDYCSLSDTGQSVKIAYRYITQYPPQGRMRVYNSVAWKLAESGIATDSAVVYAQQALQLAEGSGSRMRNMILDTYAFALYKNRQFEAAWEAQQKAMADNMDDPGYLSRFADYQFASGRKKEGIRSLLKSLLYSGETGGYQKLDEWLKEFQPDSIGQNLLRQDLVKQEIESYLQKNNTPESRSRAAVMLAFANIDGDKALDWAAAALQNIPDDMSVSERTILEKNLASIYEARGEHEKMLAVLTKIRTYIPAFDFDYWLSLGSAFEKNGQSEDALDAYISGLIWRKNDRLLKAATAILPSGESVKQKIAAAKAAELNFKPGTFDDKNIEGDRVVLAELFTGAECAPCVAADLAFDHLAEYFPRDRVLILEYHIHIPGPDPLTNSMSESRYTYYGADFGTPTVYINGTQQLVGGGPDIANRAKFYEYHDEIVKRFGRPPQLDMDLTVDRNGGLVSVQITTEADMNINGSLKVHTALVERSIDYKGSNGIEHHAFVVRYLLNGSAGQTLNLDQGNAVISGEINLQLVEDDIKSYLDNFIKNPPSRHKGFKEWRARPEKLNRDNLMIISWVQDDNSKEILQAVYKYL